MRYANKALGEKLKMLRNEKGLTQEQLAEKANVDWTTILAIENARRNPTFKTLSKLAHALEIDLSKLLSSTN